MWKLGPDADAPEWQEVESPFEKALFEVVQTVEGPCAIGDGGTLLGSREDDWGIIFDDGPKTRDNQLRRLAVTTDGERLWFAGSSGAIGWVRRGRRRPHDRPRREW